jgi:hypothetical protein
MGERALQAAFDLEGSFNDVALGLLRGADPDAVVDRVDRVLERYGSVGAYTREDQLSNWFLMNEIAQLRTFARLLPTVFLAVAAFLTNMVLARLVAVERSEIGLLKAFGYGGPAIAWHYLKLVLVICGVGGRARLFADGANEGGKGIWVVQGSDTTVLNVEFHDAKVPDQNGAGIRQEGRNLTLRNTGFYDNENGILTDDGLDSTITIESSEFARNGFGDGYTHNIYVGKIGRLNVRFSYFHEAKIGHQLKTRARENVIEYSYFMDGPNGTSSYLLNFDNGGRAVVRGNLLQKGPRADNSTLISHYSNIWGADYNSLTLEHNTLVSTYPGGRFIDVNTGAAVTLSANLFAGTNAPALASGVTPTTQQNLTATAADLPGATDIANPNFWPNAALVAKLPLANPVVTTYPTDTPKPFVSRAVSGTRQIGALQSAP